MRFSPIILLLFAMLGCDPNSQSVNYVVKKTQKQDANIEQLSVNVINAKDSVKVATLYRSLFTVAGNDGLSALKRSRYDSIAIQAAWEELTLFLPEMKVMKVYRLDKDKLNRFLGFVEGRARVKIPKWWAESVIETRAHRRSNIYPGRPSKIPYHYHAGMKYITAPHDTTVKKDGNSYILRIAKNSIRLPEEILQKTDHGDLSGSFSGCFTSKHCFIAVHGDAGYSHDVACIDRSSGKLIWKSEACGCWWGGVYGVSESWVSVTVQEDRVVVFGASSMGIYAQAFRADNGNTIFRFSDSFSELTYSDWDAFYE